MGRRVLHLLSQRPSLTGSGVTLDALVRHAARAGWEQWASVGVPVDDPHPAVGGLPPERIHPLRFGTEELPFAVPGMSDVMPYPSTRFGAMNTEMLRRYREAWGQHLRPLLARVRPDVIHAHHVWILGSLLAELAPRTPTVIHCHATGLRQMELCPHLADEVRHGCSRASAFLVLHGGHAEALVDALDLSPASIHQVGAGYRDDLFYLEGRTADPLGLVYAGKYSAAKGLPWLLDAVERLADRTPGLTLHVAGSGAGPEADELRRTMEALSPTVQLHGQLSQAELSDLLRRCAVCVLPSFYEGVPLVLVEALACGCRLVATELPGVLDQLAPHLAPYLDLVALPRLEGVDRPLAADLPSFTARLGETLDRALKRPPVKAGPELQRALASFSWAAVFGRVERVWQAVIGC